MYSIRQHNRIAKRNNISSSSTSKIILVFDFQKLFLYNALAFMTHKK